MSHRSLLVVAPLLAALGACSSAPQADVRAVFAVDGARLETGLPPYESGKRHLAAGRSALAVEAFRMAVAAERTPRTLNGLAAAWDQLGRFDLADALYGEALAMAPDDPQTLNNMGWSQLVRGEA
ncbi:MAG: hypothetical protein HQL40_19095, partial [Alphaproteobacteria bacterium]|nr:hypothetical protein [Alphaproteobacteria bacterium]